MKIDCLKIINAFVQNTKKSGVVEKTDESVAKNTSEMQASSQQKTFVSQSALLNQAESIKFNQLNTMEQAKLVKQMLNLPEDIEQLLSFLVYKKVSPETLKELLKQGGQTVDIDLIKQLLEANSKESANKLIKLFQQYPAGTQNTEQLKEILSLLNKFVPQKNSSPQEILTNLTLLYLPWLPLSEKQDVQIKIKERKQNEEEKSDEAVLVVYISTINLGRFKVSIILNKTLSMRIEIENFEENKNEKYKEFLEKILEEINAQTRKDKINAQTELLISEGKENFSKETAEKEREVVISPVKDISPVAIITAQKIVKIILETDEKISLLEARKEMQNI